MRDEASAKQFHDTVLFCHCKGLMFDTKQCGLIVGLVGLNMAFQNLF